MTLARSDLWIGTTRTTCLTEFTNTTLVNSTLLNCSPHNEDLTIFYGSSNFTMKPSNLFNCSINGTSSTAFYLTGPILNIATCSVGVRLKILQTVAHELSSNRIALREALMEGFNVNYSDCGIQPCRTPDSPEWNRQFKILIDVSASIVGAIGVVFIMIVCYLKREQLSNMGVIRKKIAKENQYAKAFIINHGLLAPKQYSYSNIKKMTHLFKNKQGQGGYGSVYKGKLFNGHLVPVKVINELKGSEEEFFNEVASISRTSHVNIVTLYGYRYERTKRALVYEFMPNGFLGKFIYNHESSSRTCQLEQKILFKIAVGVARGLEYLHRGCSTRILHLDIKHQNILLDEDFCPEISEAFSRGTIGYIAPEVFSRGFGGVSHKTDVYSYGMLILEMVGVRKIFDVGVSHASERYFLDWIYQNLNLGDVGNNILIIEEEEQMD